MTESAAETPVAVVGGGLAGLATAVRLAEMGCRVTVVETRKMLGGRATSVVDPRNEQVIDNCQHVLMGCCTNLIDLYDRLGVLDEIEWHETFHWTATRGQTYRLAAGRLPAPFHLAPSFMRMGLYDRAERRAIARGMWRVIRLSDAECQAWSNRTFTAYLESIGQPEQVIRRFWDVIITSACNLGADAVGAGHALQVFKTGFLESRWSCTMGLPRVPLVALYDAARDVLAERGGEILLGASARALAYNGDRVTGVVLGEGVVEASAIVSAVPFDRLDRLVSDTMRRNDGRLQGLERFEVSPILGVHLWFDQPIMDLPHLVLVDHEVHWLFNKGTDLEGLQHLHAVISAADAWMDVPEPEIVERVTADVHRALPKAIGLQPVQARCIKEKRATFAATPEAEAWRPTAKPEHARGKGIRNLYLAGDWCDTGWPATMEGAVRSGYAAAEAVLADRGRDAMLLVDDVPPSTLARWLRKGR